MSPEDFQKLNKVSKNNSQEVWTAQQYQDFSAKNKGKDKKGGRYRVAPPEQRTADGIVFDSRSEMEDYVLLKRLIPGRLHLQPRFLLQAGGEIDLGAEEESSKLRPIHYVADFLISSHGPRKDEAAPLLDGELVLDSKGHETVDFKIKRKLFLVRYQRPLFLIKSRSQLLDLLRRYKFML